MKKIRTITLGLAVFCVAWQAAAQVTLYEREGLRGQVFTADRSVNDLERYGFNDRASSLIVQSGQWQVCEHANFEGHCTILRPGQYASLAEMGMNNRISSLRKVQGSSKHAYAPAPSVPVPYAYYPHHGERLYPANVVAVRAVMGPPEQRCWVEQQQVPEQQPERARAPSSAASWAASLAIRSAMVAATTLRRPSARSAARPSAPTSTAAARPRRRTCSVVPRFPDRRRPSIGT